MPPAAIGATLSTHFLVETCPSDWLEAVTDFDRSCFRVLPAERSSLAPPKFPFRSNFQQGQVAVHLESQRRELS